MRFQLLLMLSAGLCAGCGDGSMPTNLPPNPALSPNAPKDQPVDAKGKNARAEEYRAAIAPYVEKGRQTYSAAKKRYLDGLPPGHSFFAVTNLRDGSGTSEQVFIAVASIKDGRITGRIASDVLGVKGFKNGNPYSFPRASCWTGSLPTLTARKKATSWASSWTSGRRLAPASRAWVADWRRISKWCQREDAAGYILGSHRRLWRRMQDAIADLTGGAKAHTSKSSCAWFKCASGISLDMQAGWGGNRGELPGLPVAAAAETGMRRTSAAI